LYLSSSNALNALLALKSGQFSRSFFCYSRIKWKFISL